jgi:hypothetical protein
VAVVRSINRKFSGRSRVDELKAPGKPFEISKRAVWEAWEKVKANKGAPGVDGTSIEEFEKDLRGNLYKIWNRMSSGTYFPPPVRAVEIPKKGGVRILGVPAIGDRVAQTVVAAVIGERAEPVFHPDSYGYRPKRSALDAVLEEGLGDRLGHPGVLRLRAVGSGRQSSPRGVRRAVGGAVCQAVACCAAGTS